jgi:hypothetical protein
VKFCYHHAIPLISCWDGYMGKKIKEKKRNEKKTSKQKKKGKIKN